MSHTIVDIFKCCQDKSWLWLLVVFVGGTLSGFSPSNLPTHREHFQSPTSNSKPNTHKRMVLLVKIIIGNVLPFLKLE